MSDERQDTGAVIHLYKHRSSGLDSGDLAFLQEELASVDQITEAFFLELGSKVEAFHGRALEISSRTGEVFELLSGDAGEGALQHLQLLVERCCMWLNATGEKSTKITTILQEVQRQVECFESPVGGLRKVIKTLHSLRVSTRIEAAKGYASGASVLAKSLDDLGNLVYAKIGEIIERVESLKPLLNTSLEMEKKARSGAVRVTENEVKRARNMLSAFLNSCIESGQWSDRLKSRSGQVAQNFGELIVALQFQDITRQRLEHIQQALANLEAHMGKLTESAKSGDDNRLAVEALFARICRLQHGQLVFACEEFTKAADNLDENLRAMPQGVLALADDTYELSRSSDVEHESRIETVLQMLKSIADYLDETIAVHEAAGHRLSDVCDGINEVTELVLEIELIGEEMQLLAMNAAISAAHARQRGAGLDIIAGNIHVVAEEATAHALSLAKECETITGLAEELQTIEQDAKSSSADVGNLLSEAQERLAMLEGSSQLLKDMTGEIDRDTRCLVTDVDNAVRNLDIKSRFEEKLEPVVERLDLLGANADENQALSGDKDLDALFRELEYCYTMDSERQVHQQFVADLGDGSADVHADADEWAQNRDHDLGDNVDLF